MTAAPRSKALHVALVIAALGAALAPVASAGAEEGPCPNEQARKESNVNPATGQPYSTQLPDCRAYELVSPPDTGGLPAPTREQIPGNHRTVIAADGSLFFVSRATPAGTGAIADGGYYDVFRSRRSSSGWVTKDMTAFGSAPGNKILVAASADGSSVLIETTLSLSPEDLDNPTNNVTYGGDLYLVREDAQPLFVSHGEIPNTAIEQISVIGGGSLPVFANTDLSAVGFTTNVSLQRVPSKTPTPGCYQWADVGSRLAFLTNPDEAVGDPQPNCRWLGIAADGRAIIEDTSGDFYTGRMFAAGGGDNFPLGGDTAQLSGDTQGAASFAALSPGGETVYLTTTGKLTPNAGADVGADLYAIDLTYGLLSGEGLFAESPPSEPAVTCVSCEAAGSPNGAGVSWAGQSADGSHVFFRLSNGDLYEHDAKGTRLVARAADGLEHLVFSHNGLYAIATTPVALSSSDTNGTSDVYLLTDGAPPQLITSGTTVASYTPVAVSDSGQRVLYENERAGESSNTIDESSGGQTSQISPVGSTHVDSLIGTAGAELEDVFFAAHEPLVRGDRNAGTQDIYDARAQGDFPPCTAGNPNPPPSSSSCSPPMSTPNPQPPSPSPYTANLGLAAFILSLLPGDTSHPASKPKSLSCHAKARGIKSAKKRGQALKRCVKPKPRKKASKSGRGRSQVTSGSGGGR